MWQKVYFDLDNTLFSYEYAFEKAIQDCYQDVVDEWIAQGVEFPYIPLEDWFDVFKFYSDFFWPAYEKKELTQQEYRRKRYLETMKHFGLPSHVEEADRFHDKYYRQAVHYVKPYPGLYSLLEFLRGKNIETGIITNGKTDVQKAKFAKLKLKNLIPEKNVYISEQVGLKKPDPALFKKVLGKVAPHEALFIGDSWEHDIVGALEAGWDAIFLNTRHGSRTTDHEPLAELFHLTQVLSYLQDVLEK